ncbi:DEAD/DEAH box helicase family protein [Vibrio vulnificus]|uniref:DEAD/DEAH box helicase n=1 Tax=Vibrio vulnificus TaxID=672 RepID=UPI001CDBDC74|nr:DEAD/DEAH box helicase family protein [Vibrio vulnificus]MCA3903869.1 DEAD/DEAH box helicase family protein [Vibrio vulnificus]
MLRTWQGECIDKALKKYCSGQPHFFCQATPGAGKSIMSATLAKTLLDKGMIDLILCFSPSVSVADGMRATFSTTINCAFNGSLGSIGQSLTYQSIQYLGDDFWRTIEKYRLLVVFDEIHHCSGDEPDRANIWGQQILARIQGIATYTLALSGTPWRSDKFPIVLAEYSDPEGKLFCDYQYGLAQAIADNVCRKPKLVLVDNEHLTISEGSEKKSFASILELLKQSKTSYQDVIHNTQAMEYVLGLGCQKLNEIRKESFNAGGLVVASSVKHAKQVQKILTEKFGQSATLVTYHHDDPQSEIKAYQTGTTQWIVSVGMISEGTDIPRLQVCCHISAVKTELYFRQVLGRILRVNDSPNQEAWLYTFAEQNLIEYAERIEHDIPETCLFAKIGKEEYAPGLQVTNQCGEVESVPAKIIKGYSQLDWGIQSKYSSSGRGADDIFDEIWLGRFRERVVSAFL